jgi:uncharacterized protein YcfJ
VERSDLARLVLFILVGAVAGALIGTVITLATGVALATVFGGVAGSYLGMITADNRFGPRSRKVRLKRAEEARRQAALAEREASRAEAQSRRAPTGRAARKATVRAKR